MNGKNSEELIIKILDLKEQGKTLDEILNLFPEEKEVVEEILKTIDFLKKGKEAAKPSKELLTHLLLKLPQTVADTQKTRYLYEEEKSKGRSFIWFSKALKEIIMSKKVYVTLAVAVIIALFVGGYFFWFSPKDEISPIPNKIASEETLLNEDFADLEGMNEDNSLQNLDEDLAKLTEEVTEEDMTPDTETIVEIASLEGLDDELVLELDGFNTDLSDLNNFEQDSSLGDFDSDLANVSE